MGIDSIQMIFRVCFLVFLFLFSLSFTACARLGDFDDVSTHRLVEAYTPNVDIYIFRSPSDGVLDHQRGFHVEGVENIAEYLLQFFSDRSASINEFQLQNDMAFYASNIRIFFVTAQSGMPESVTATYLDRLDVTDDDRLICPIHPPGQIPIAHAGVDTEDIVTFDGQKIYFGDLGIAGYQVGTGVPVKKLYMTNHAGTDLQGPEIRIDPNHIRIFFADIVSPCNPSPSLGVAGLASIGTAERLQSGLRATNYMAISSRYNVNGLVESAQVYNLRVSIAHEMGHFFGLFHPFEQNGGQPLSCRFDELNTTNRIMDYSQVVSTFIPCEQDIYRTRANHFLDGQRVTYEFSENGELISHGPQKSEVRSTGSPLYRGLSTENRIAAEEGRVQIYDSDHYHEAVYFGENPKTQRAVPLEALLSTQIKHDVIPR